MASGDDPYARRQSDVTDAVAIQVAVLQTQLSELRGDVTALSRATETIGDRLNVAMQGRPAWPVVALLTLETSAIAALVAALITRR